jgi:hypothetical protein
MLHFDLHVDDFELFSVLVATCSCWLSKKKKKCWSKSAGEKKKKSRYLVAESRKSGDC